MTALQFYPSNKLKILTRFILISLFYGCQSNIYVNQGIEGETYLQLCKNGNFIMNNYGFPPYSTPKKIYGIWKKNKDTIIVSYINPKPYYSYDSTAIVREKNVKNRDSIYFKIQYPYEQYFIGLWLDKKRFKPKSMNDIKLPVLAFNEFELATENYYIKHRKINKNSNYFMIIFHKQVPKNLDSMLIDPPVKFLVKSNILIPLEVYSNKKMSYQYKRKFFLINGSPFKGEPLCKNKK